MRRGGRGKPGKQRRSGPKAAKKTSLGVSIASLQDQVASLTRDLKEAREQQSAAGEVLKVISGSAFELHTVLLTLVDSAMHLCEAEPATIWRPDVFRLAALRSFSREFEEFARQNPIAPGRGTVTARVALVCF